MKADRLTARDWTKEGLRALASSGFSELKADTLAKTLGVSRGSFYWHFKDLAAFHDAVLNHWREVAFTNIVDEVDAAPNEKLRALLHRVFRASTRLERAMRAWAASEPRIRTAVAEIDARRMDYISGLLLERGLPRETARLRTQILYWTYLGHVISGRTLSQPENHALTKELLRQAINH